MGVPPPPTPGGIKDLHQEEVFGGRTCPISNKIN